jgi:hypothetical protein
MASACPAAAACSHQVLAVAGSVSCSSTKIQKGGGPGNKRLDRDENGIACEKR